MQRRKIIVLFLFLFIALNIFSQQRSRGSATVEIRGSVFEKGSNEPVEQATIRLLAVKDSSLVTGTVSEKGGAFSLKNVRTGSYILQASFVGFESVYQLLQISGRVNPVNLEKIELADASILLGEAVVIGKAAEVQVRNDTIEYNADSYKVQEGAVLEELVKRMPGAEVSSEGKITINGKEVKKILVDGKEFFSDDPQVASKNLPARMVDKVQVVDRKSDMTLMTGFDDGNEETVINLVVKPGMKEGWFGSAMGGYGNESLKLEKTNRYEGNVVLNRFVNNDQISVLGGTNNTNNIGFSDFASTMFQGMGGGGMRMAFGGGGRGLTTSSNIGLNINKEVNKTLTINGNVRYNNTDNYAETSSRTETYLPGDITKFTDSQNKGNRLNNNLGGNIRMEWKPDTMTNIIFRPNFTYSKSNTIQEGESHTQMGPGRNIADADSISDVDSRSESEGNNLSLSANFDFSRKLNSKGRVVSVSLSGGLAHTTDDGKNYSFSDYHDGTPDYLIDQEYHYKNGNNNYRAFASWVEPIAKGHFLQATYSFSRRNQESDRPVYTQDENGDYTVPDTSYIQKYNYTFQTQRASLSYKGMKEKFNYTIGANLDPSNSKGLIYKNDIVVEEIKRSVLNFSPSLQFNYLFSKQSNLRLDYNGRSSEPSMAQLQQVRDVTDPNNIVTGNSKLKPSYENTLSLNFRKFIPEQQTNYVINANGGYTLNGIVNETENLSGGAKRTTYTNADGNYNGNLRFNMNTPFKYKGSFSKFSINTGTSASFRNSNSIVDHLTSATKELTLSERLGLNYRSDYFDIGANGNISYKNNRNSLRPDNETNTYNYGAGGSTTIYLYNIAPAIPLVIESDINYSGNAGYSTSYSQKETMWNASLASKPLKIWQGTGTFRLKVYDILQQRSNISNSFTDNMYSESRSNTLTSFCILHFVYRFQIFKGGAKMDDAFGGRRRFEGGGPPPGGGGYGGPPDRMF